MKALNRSKKGFSLIELMIVVAILGILAAIAVPNFLRYQLRSKTSEARTNIGAVRIGMEAFRGDFDGFPTAIAATPAVIPAGTKVAFPVPAPCPAACTRANLGACNIFDCIGYRPNGPVYYQYQITGGTLFDYVIESAADLDGDTTFGQFGYRADGNGDNAAPAAAGIAAACAAAPINEITDCATGAF